MFAGKPMAALDVVLVYVVPQEKNKTVANTRLINFNFILNYFKLRVTFCPQLFKHFAKEKFTNGLIFWNVCWDCIIRLKTNYDSYSIESIQKETWKEQTAYELKLKGTDDTTVKLLVDTNGNIIKQKTD